MKIVLLLLFIYYFQSTFWASYTGHMHGWTDNIHEGQRTEWPITIHWTEAKDSSWAEMKIFREDRRVDTVAFHHYINEKWQIYRWNSDTTLRSAGPVRIYQTADSLIVSMGFGYSGATYYGRKN